MTEAGVLDDLEYDLATWVRARTARRIGHVEFCRLTRDACARTARLITAAERSRVDDLRRVLLSADHCHGIVTKDGEQDACGKPPTTVIVASDLDDGGHWPACTYHAHRYGRDRVVPLPALLAVLR